MPATKGSYSQYTASTTAGGKPTIYATKAEYMALYYKDAPQGRMTRAKNPHTAHHVHLSNRLAAAAKRDAWHNKDRASGQR